MISLGIDLHKPKYNPKIKSTYKNPTLSPEKCDQIWFELIDFLTKNEFCEISDKLLQFISEKTQSSVEYKLAKAKIKLFFKQNEEVIKLCDEILLTEQNNYDAWVLRGHAYYFKNNLFDSEESYIKAIKYKDKNSNKYDIKMLTRLGIIYIKRKTWNDAKVVFLQILKDNVYHSFAWRYLGLALTNLEEYAAAEEALNESISLNDESVSTMIYKEDSNKILLYAGIQGDNEDYVTDNYYLYDTKENSIDLIEKILVTDPKKRITIPEIKKHPFYIKGKNIFAHCIGGTVFRIVLKEIM